MSVTIRVAGKDDVETIIDIVRKVWPDSDVHREAVWSAIRQDHATLLAEVDGQAAGFVDGFVTTSFTGERRWEVDLLAVAPQFQGQGIGRQLIGEHILYGQENRATYTRGLIEIQNVASQRAFARCGFQSDVSVCGLYIASVPLDLNGQAQLSKHLIPVHTINYKGWWLEGEQTANALSNARGFIQPDVYDLVGTLIPLTSSESIEQAVENGYELAGHYQFWRRAL